MYRGKRAGTPWASSEDEPAEKRTRMSAQDSDDEVDPDADEWFEESQVQLSPLTTQENAAGTRVVCPRVRKMHAQA